MSPPALFSSSHRAIILLVHNVAHHNCMFEIWLCQQHDCTWKGRVTTKYWGKKRQPIATMYIAAVLRALMAHITLLWRWFLYHFISKLCSTYENPQLSHLGQTGKQNQKFMQQHSQNALYAHIPFPPSYFICWLSKSVELLCRAV